MLIAAAVSVVLATTSVALPGDPPVGMDYLAFDAVNHRVWIPAGNTGNIDVLDVVTGKLTTLGGFPTRPSSRPNRPPMGPSSATVGAGKVWVGNRGDNTVCAFDGRSLEKQRCIQLAVMPDGVQYVAATDELWITTPADQSLVIVGVKTAALSHLKLDGDPEGYAVDEARGVFYTNLEDKDRTLAIDLKTRKVLSSWTPGCGKEGPRGLALDGARRLLLVACTDGAVSLDLAHDGKVVGRIKTGAGVDNLEYAAQARRLYIASGADGMLTVADVADGGAIKSVAQVATATGARNPILDGAGTLYVEDSAGGRLIVVRPK